MAKKDSDFRYNTGDSRVPWPAVGENYNERDLMEVIKFMQQGSGEEYDRAMEEVAKAVQKLTTVSEAPGKLSLGTEVERAEAAVDELLGTTGSLFVNNATAGFEIAYKYANLKAGDEVIVPAITFIATMAYPLSIGCKLVFADVDPKTMCMDPADVARKITPKTKMIVPVHLGGYPVDMDPLMKLANEHNVLVLEDAAHAFGGSYHGKKMGTIGDFGAYSFHEVKNCTSFGEGGIMVTSDDKLREQAKATRFFGLNFDHKIKDWLYDVRAIEGKYEPFVGINSSTTEIQGLGLRLQIERYQHILDVRRAAAEYLDKRFAGNPAILPQELGDNGTEPTFHLYLLRIDPEKAGGDIQLLKQKLTEKGVTQIAHFGPLYRFDVLRTFGYDADEIAKTCPVCEEYFYHRYTHLPLYGISQEQLAYMADAVLESIEEMQKGI